MPKVNWFGILKDVSSSPNDFIYYEKNIIHSTISLTIDLKNF